MRERKSDRLLVAGILSGCLGGGGGSSASTPAAGACTSGNICGTAATGAPVANGSIAAFDSSIIPQVFLGKTDALGAYTLPVPGGTAPYLLTVVGTSAGRQVTLTSMAATAGTTANITPLTDLIVSTAAAQPAGTSLFNLCRNAATADIIACQRAKTAALANLSASTTSVMAMIAPLNTANTNPLTDAFVANGSGMDKVLDSIVVVAPTVQGTTGSINLVTLPTQSLGTVTLPATVPSNNAPATTAVVAPSTAAELATAMTEIQATLTAFQNLFATVAPATTTPILALLDPTFLSGGQTAAQFAAIQLTPKGFPIGRAFSAPVAIVSPDGAFPNDATHQWFRSRVNSALSWLAIKQPGGKWLLAGDQRQVGVSVITTATQQWTGCLGVGCPTVLYYVNMDISVAGGTTGSVSGPGVIGATAGVEGAATMVMAGNLMIPACSVGLSTNCVDMTKVVPGNYVFTINGTSPVGSPTAGTPFTYVYTEANAVIPPAAATLTAAMFPAFSVAPTRATFLSGATVTVNWTVPTGLTPNGMSVYMANFGLPAEIFLWMNATGVALTQSTSVTLPVFTGVLSGGNVTVQANDSNGVIYQTLQPL